MQQTSNLKLKKPEGTDVINIQDLNDNADILDKAISKINQRHKVCEDNGWTIDLPAGTDLNNLLETGFYRGKNTVNGPPSLGATRMYIEIVAGSSANVLQKAYHMFDNTACYIRRKPQRSQDWTAWEAYAMDKDVEALRKTVAEVKAASLPLTGGTVKGALQTTGHFTCGGFDFNLGTADQAARGDSGPSRAMAKLIGNVLAVNYAGDFKGGIHLQGPKTQVDGTLMVGGKDVAKELAAIGQRHKVCNSDGTAIRLAEGTDLNTLTKTGFYVINMPKNAPASVSTITFVVVITYGTGITLQKLYVHLAGKAYIRNSNGGIWTPWVAMATEKDIQTLGQKVFEAKEQANTAAKQAETNAKAHTDTKLAEVKQRHKVCEDGGTTTRLAEGTDLNTIIETGFYTGNKIVNGPSSFREWMYLEVVAHSGVNILQKAYHMFDNTACYIRRKPQRSHDWTPWVAMATEKDIAEVDKKLAEVKQSGVELKKKLADAINAKGVKVSASEEFSAVISKVGEIHTGGKITISAKYDSENIYSEREYVIATLPPRTTLAKFLPQNKYSPYSEISSTIDLNWEYARGGGGWKGGNEIHSCTKEDYKLFDTVTLYWVGKYGRVKTLYEICGDTLSGSDGVYFHTDGIRVDRKIGPFEYRYLPVIDNDGTINFDRPDNSGPIKLVVKFRKRSGERRRSGRAEIYIQGELIYY